MVNEKQSPKQAIDEFIADNLKEFLKSHGFAKRGRTWTKRHESIVYIVNIQSDRWNAVNSVPSFFVNYGIYTPLVSSNGNPSKDTTRLNNLTIGECLICERVTRRMIHGRCISRGGGSVLAEDTMLPAKCSLMRLKNSVLRFLIL